MLREGIGWWFDVILTKVFHVTAWGFVADSLLFMVTRQGVRHITSPQCLNPHSISTMFSYFLPAPLVALFTVPVIGHWSDICTSQWGRRRPFIFGLSLFLILSLVLLCIGQNLVSTKGSSSTNGWAAECRIKLNLLNLSWH